jgi:hypothetical protein
MAIRPYSAFLALLVCIAGRPALGQTSAPASPGTRPAQMSSVEWNVEWYRRILVEGYRAFGDGDAAWDQSAMRAVEAIWRWWSESPDRTGDEAQVAYLATNEAVGRGCTDPLVLYLHARGEQYFGMSPQDAWDKHLIAADALSDSQYHPYLKCAALLRAALIRAHDLGDPVVAVNDEQVQALVAEAEKLVPQIASEPDVPAEAITALMDYFGDLSRVAYGDRRHLAAAVYGQVEKGTRERVTVLVARAAFNLKYAEDAIGLSREDLLAAPPEGLTIDPSPEALRLHEQRLERAVTAIGQAEALDPGNTTVVVMMHRVQAAQGADREQVERWYAKAAALAPDSTELRKTHLEYLMEESDDDDEVLAFGRQLLTEGNFRAGLPIILAEAHDSIGLKLLLEQVTNGPTEGFHPLIGNNKAYFRRPETWADISAVFEGLIREHPESLYYRSLYAMGASAAGRSDVVAEQLDAMGGQRSWMVLSDQHYESLKAEVREFKRR